jgi:transcriptional regulator
MDDNLMRLKQISFLLAAQAVHGFMADSTQSEKIVFLSRAGFSNQEVADFVGTSAAAVSVRLSENKKAKTTKVLKKIKS